MLRNRFSVAVLGLSLAACTSAPPVEQKSTPAQTAVKPEEPKPVPKKTGEWIVLSDKSSFDDSPSETIVLEASNEIAGWLKRSKPRLTIRCQENKTELYVVTDMPPAVENARNTATVRVRLDSDPTFTSEANKSTDGEALFLAEPIESIKAILESKRMLFGFVPFNASPVEVVFDLAGIEEAIKPVRKACKW